MSGPSAEKTTPIEGRAQLIEYLASGSKPPADWRIGTEHEKFGFRHEDLKPIPYEGERGIRALLEGIAKFGWERVEENGHLIALVQDKASVTLEPAGQLELSGAPLETIHDTCRETAQHLYEVKAAADPLRLGFLGMGFQPKWRRDEMPWMPKGRYKIMREYMPKVGSLGLDMMTRTCTIQTNLDFSSEADMVKKFRVSLALQPVATALFADSPFTEGKPNGFMSFSDHLTTAFPEVRLKKYLEMRGADGGPWNRICALSAYWVGLLYDDAALDAAWDLVKDFTLEERHALRDGVPRHGFKLPFRGATMRELAMESLKISEAGLKRRARLNRSGASEAVYLEPLIEMALANQTAAERKLELFHGEWNGSVDPLFKEFAY